MQTGVVLTARRVLGKRKENRNGEEKVSEKIQETDCRPNRSVESDSEAEAAGASASACNTVDDVAEI